jgi:hypothetical protein
MSRQGTGESAEIIHESEWVTLWYHSEVKVVHHRFHKAIRGEAFRTALLQGTALLQHRGATKWLSDDRLVFVLPQADQEWADREWFPQTMKAGWKYWAIARPERAVADLYIRRVAANRSAAGVKTELFGTPEAGMDWLTNQPV